VTMGVEMVGTEARCSHYVALLTWLAGRRGISDHSSDCQDASGNFIVLPSSMSCWLNGGVVVDMDERDESEEKRTLKRSLRSELPIVPYLLDLDSRASTRHYNNIPSRGPVKCCSSILLLHAPNVTISMSIPLPHPYEITYPDPSFLGSFIVHACM